MAATVTNIFFKLGLRRIKIPTFEFRPSLATPILFLVDVRRDVPYFYDTFLVQIVASVATPD